MVFQTFLSVVAEVIHGNTTTMKFFAAWKNIHWIFRGKLHLFAGLAASHSQNESDAPQGGSEPPVPHLTNLAKAFIASVAQQQGQPPSPEKTEQIKIALGQQMFDFA
jgi:hypothetical protein